MAAPILAPSDCCNPCSDITIQQIPGPAGAAGTNGTNGTDGVDAFTNVIANFTQPAVNGNVTVQVAASVWAKVGQVVYIATGGYYSVNSQVDGTHLSIKNLGYTGNAAPAAGITAPQGMSPGGIKGTDGSGGTSTLNDLSPTTTRGDLIVDNGSNSPLASDVRLGVGTDGELLVADSTQPTGLSWKQTIPNVSTDNAIVRFDGAAGTPVPLQNSKMIVTDDGALQSSGSGGNARGAKAVDLQTQRALGTMVASGAASVITGGVNNTASGDESAVTGGLGNIASGNSSSICGGTSNTASGANASLNGGGGNVASGDNSVVCGGLNNTASNPDSTVSGGNTNTASGPQSSVLGGDTNTASAQGATVVGGSSNTSGGNYSSIPGGISAVTDKFGQISHSSGSFNNDGDSQLSELIWRKATTDATAGVEMFLDGTALRGTIPANTTWGVDIILVGRSSAGVEAVWSAKGGIHNNAGATAVTAAFTIAMICDGTGGTWGVVGSFAVTADNANDSLKLAVTGAVATNIRWTAHARIVEVNF